MTTKRNAIAALSLSAAALVGIATHEGYVGQAYRDIVGAAFCSEWIAQAGGVPNPELYNPGTLRDLNRYLNEVMR